MTSDLFSADTHAEPAITDLLAHSDHGDGSVALLHRNVFSSKCAERLFQQLHAEVCWQQHQITVFGKTYNQPRLDAWYAEPGLTYTYSNVTQHPQPWIAPILEIKSACQRLANTEFNSVLLNLYRNGDDAMGWHSDNEPELGAEPVIASVSFGAERRFDLRHKVSKETIKALLPQGSVLLMAGRLQQEWVHQVARTKKVHEPRINLTFRTISPR